jgi:hypothetical protein
MEKYVCPMHPEITSSKPARCSKCGMKLVHQSKVSNMPSHDVHTEHKDKKVTIKDYQPLFVIVGLIALVALTLSWAQGITIERLIEYFMIGFFITFSGFKLIDLDGFAQGYSTYDLIAKRWYGYGYIYPFIELGFGLLMIVLMSQPWLLLLEIVVMVVSGLGVAIKLAKKEQFQCACLGTFLKVPLTKITLVEDFGMAALAFVLLVMK